MSNLDNSMDFFMPIDSPHKVETIYDSFGKIDVNSYIKENFSSLYSQSIQSLDSIDACYWTWISPSHKALKVLALHIMVDLIKTKEDLLEFMKYFQCRNIQAQNLPLMFYISYRKYEELYKT